MVIDKKRPKRVVLPMINFKKHQILLRNLAFMITVHLGKIIQVCVAFNAPPQHHLTEDEVVVS